MIFGQGRSSEACWAEAEEAVGQEEAVAGLAAAEALVDLAVVVVAAAALVGDGSEW